MGKSFLMMTSFHCMMNIPDHNSSRMGKQQLTASFAMVFIIRNFNLTINTSVNTYVEEDKIRLLHKNKKTQSSDIAFSINVKQDLNC